MSLKPQEFGPIPEETARVAHAAYPKGNVFMRMRDELGTMYQDEDFAHLFSHTGQPAEARLSLGSSHGHAVCGGAFRSPGCRCSAGADRLQVHSWSGTQRPWL